MNNINEIPKAKVPSEHVDIWNLPCPEREEGRFEPDWESLSNYQAPDWFRDSKLGFWSHWDPQSVPEEGDWYARWMYDEGHKDHVLQIKRKLGISGVASSISVWSGKGDDESKGAQIDLLIDRKDRVINVCEIKYSTSEYEIDKDTDLNLRNKIDAFVRESKSKASIQLTMITTYGVHKNKYSGVVNNQVVMDLFQDVE